MSVIYIKNIALIVSQTVSLKVVITPPRAKPTWLNDTLRQWVSGNTRELVDFSSELHRCTGNAPQDCV